MIPTIEEICKGLFAGDFTVEQAIEWLYQHMELASEKTTERDERLGLAMQFAAAWLPILYGRDHMYGTDALIRDGNTLGLAMADDLIRRLREGQT